MGFRAVYDYTLGKSDWMAAGLPTVRADGTTPRALDVADRHPLTCAPDDSLGELPPRRLVVVTGAEAVVLGRIGLDRSGDPRRRAEDVMRPGPTTVRADEPLEPLLERMRRADVAEMIVTSPEGRLLGVVHRPSS